MDIRKFAQKVIGITGNETSHNGRYINLDGTPYGSKGLARAVLSPRIPVVAGIFALSGGATMFLQPEPIKIMAQAVLLSAPNIMFWEVLDRTGFHFSAKQKKFSAIDRKGLDGDPLTTHRAAEFFRNRATTGFVIVCALATLTARSAEAYWFCTALLGTTIYDIKAARKLASGKWSAMTELPKKRERKPKPLRSKLRLPQISWPTPTPVPVPSR